MGKKSKAAPASPSKAPLTASLDLSAAPQKTQPLSHTKDEESRDDSDDESNDETDGIDEKGMKRLMELLGDDALDELSAAQLDALKGASDISENSTASEDASGSEAEREDVSGDGASEGNEAIFSNDDSGGSDAEEYADSEDEKMASAENEAEDEEEDIALDDRDDISIDEDAVPKQKVIIDNKVALRRIRETIKLDPSFSWVETLAVTYPEPLEVSDPDNDLERELAFYKQALHGAQTARQLASTSKPPLPFTRPSDYFAEMVKSDSHMERIRQKLLDERAGIVKSEEARRQRELKKVGKQVQVEKLKERIKGRKEMEERLKGLKRKRGGGLDGGDDDDAFDVGVEDAISDKPRASGPFSKRGKGNDGKPKSKIPRSARDAKFGFGGKGKRREKQNTRESTNDFAGGGGRSPFQGRHKAGKAGKTKRLGKSRRHPGRS